MSLACGLPLLECVYLAGCVRWGWKKCVYIGAFDSASWNEAAFEEFEPVPQICRTILAVYEEDLSKPLWEPPGGYRLDLDSLVKRVDYDQTDGLVPPYIIYVDHETEDIILAIRGLNLGKNNDYRTLLDNKLGSQMFDGGYVHHGLLKSAAWLLNREAATLIELIEQYPKYTLTFAGHSLGAGVASLATLMVSRNREALGKISRERLRCFGVAPARCMSLNLAVQYADIMHSVILQDDFLPRTSTPLEDIFGAALCLPCVMRWRCCVDTCTSRTKKLKDPRRLYAPGRMYHIVERHFCSCGRFPPEVRTGIPVEGRFDQVVLSCNASSDHSIVEIEKEAQIALEIMRDCDISVPAAQKMERQGSMAEGHRKDRKIALERAVTLNVPYAFAPEDPTKDESDEDLIVNNRDGDHIDSRHGESSLEGDDEAAPSKPPMNWNHLVDLPLEKSRSGHIDGDGKASRSGGQTSSTPPGQGESAAEGENGSPIKQSSWHFFRQYSKSKLVRSFEEDNGEPLLKS